MAQKVQTHIKRNCFSIYIISNKLQIGYYTATFGDLIDEVLRADESVTPNTVSI
jgi:hypothetical protein